MSLEWVNGVFVSYMGSMRKGINLASFRFMVCEKRE